MAVASVAVAGYLAEARANDIRSSKIGLYTGWNIQNAEQGKKGMDSITWVELAAVIV